MREKIEKLIERHKELEELLASPEVTGDLKRMEELGREYTHLGKMLPTLNEYLETSKRLSDAKNLVKTESDEELVALAQEEIQELEESMPEMEKKVKALLVPKDPADEKNAIVEIRAGTGGIEAGIFAADLYRMYIAFIESKGWSYEVMSTSPGRRSTMAKASCHLVAHHVCEHLQGTRAPPRRL